MSPMVPVYGIPIQSPSHEPSHVGLVSLYYSKCFIGRVDVADFDFVRS